jgi:hypothetical protein
MAEAEEVSEKNDVHLPIKRGRRGRPRKYFEDQEQIKKKPGRKQKGYENMGGGGSDNEEGQKRKNINDEFNE